MGIPIASPPGEGFELVEGFYVPPLMFQEEAVALTLGLRLLTALLALGRAWIRFESRKNSKPEKSSKNAVRTHRQLHAVLARSWP
ncbi:MAG: hypothetical protein HND47_15290 [Chloroflexi bacterium]|nr:hypothetical protein [Chloroflexota bacterium]